TGQRGIKNDRQRGAEEKRRHDAGVADDESRSSALSNNLGVELEADEEHEHEEPDLAQRVEKPEAARGEEQGGHAGCLCPEDRWAKGDAGEHLADDLWLAE